MGNPPKCWQEVIYENGYYKCPLDRHDLDRVNHGNCAHPPVEVDGHKYCESEGECGTSNDSPYNKCGRYEIYELVECPEPPTCKSCVKDFDDAIAAAVAEVNAAIDAYNDNIIPVVEGAYDDCVRGVNGGNERRRLYENPGCPECSPIPSIDPVPPPLPCEQPPTPSPTIAYTDCEFKESGCYDSSIPGTSSTFGTVSTQPTLDDCVKHCDEENEDTMVPRNYFWPFLESSGNCVCFEECDLHDITGIGDLAFVEKEAATGKSCPTSAICFTADALVTMADGTKKPIAEVHEWEHVSTGTGSGTGIVTKVFVTKVNMKIPVAILETPEGVLIGTQDHHILVDGEWMEMGEAGRIGIALEERFVDYLYNLEIDGDAVVGESSQSFVVNGIVASGLGDGSDMVARILANTWTRPHFRRY